MRGVARIGGNTHGDFLPAFPLIQGDHDVHEIHIDGVPGNGVLVPGQPVIDVERPEELDGFFLIDYQEGLAEQADFLSFKIVPDQEAVFPSGQGGRDFKQAMVNRLLLIHPNVFYQAFLSVLIDDVQAEENRETAGNTYPEGDVGDFRSVVYLSGLRIDKG